MRMFAPFLGLVFLLAACKTQTPAPTSDLERIASAHVALLRLKSSLKTADSLRSPEAFASAAADSLRTYGFTKEQFEKAFLLLSDSPARLKRFNELTAGLARQ
jgi:hypothetical protein